MEKLKEGEKKKRIRMLTKGSAVKKRAVEEHQLELKRTGKAQRLNPLRKQLARLSF